MGAGVIEIDASAFDAELRNGADVLVLDTRAPDTYAAWHVEAASGTVLNIPEPEIETQLERLLELARPGASVRVICAAGRTSRRVAALLGDRGVDAVSVHGGMAAWSRVLREDAVPVGGGFEVTQFRREARGCLSYLVTVGAEGMVVDPTPDPRPYIAAAARRGAHIVRVVDTHVHADHVSGARDLASATHATLHLSEAALARGIRYADRVEALADGDTLALAGGYASVVALPGHTSDMIGIRLGEEALLSGDSLFTDAVARPDLEDGDAGAPDAARRLCRTLRERVGPLPGSMLLLPGHYPGGWRSGPVAEPLESIRAQVAELALGEDEFVARVLRGRPPKPANHRAIIAVNLGEDVPFDEVVRLELGSNNCAAKPEWAA